jgi:S-formylglutathione hydrolase
MERVGAARCFDGSVEFWRHRSKATATQMEFSVFIPPQAKSERVPILYWLSGLTCTAENFTTKAGAQRWAAEHGLMLVAPDTSPRGAGIPGEADDYDLGLGAGFYVNATTPGWSDHYRMYDYVVDELPELVKQHFPAAPDREAIFGHSMGGHGALVCALRNPGRYRSVSAFAPICAPCECPWGQKAFGAYLGADRETWAAYDASRLVEKASERLPLLIDQGSDDNFLAEQLLPERLEAACAAADHPLELRRQVGYDHSYYFIATFVGDHIAHHARALRP